MIELSYSHGKPSTSADVMTPIFRTFELPKNGGAHSVTAEGSVDNAVSLTVWAVLYNAENRPVRFSKTEGDQTTIIECGYDYLGRRFMKKVTIDGAVTLHQRYLYRGYLQIACVDLARSAHPCLWLTMWDPTEPVATRPLAIQKNGTWYNYGHDLTRNVMELYKADGTITTAYEYAPYGKVTAIGIDQPFQWSSEFHDTELGLVYYNDRYYDPAQGRC